jgi:hypothetical protein
LFTAKNQNRSDFPGVFESSQDVYSSGASTHPTTDFSQPDIGPGPSLIFPKPQPSVAVKFPIFGLLPTPKTIFF